MKTTLLTFAISLFLFSCHQTDDEILDHFSEKGTVTFSAEIAERKAIKLSNAKTLAEKDNHGPTLEIWQGETLIEDGITVHNNDSETITLAPGAYKAVLKSIVADGKYAGKIEAEGEENFTVEANSEKEVLVTMYAKDLYVSVKLTNLPGATVWAGEKGFTPDDSYELLDIGGGEHVGNIFAEGEFDVIVEFEAEQKRYTATANPGSEYFINIVKNEDEEPTETGKVGFAYQIFAGSQVMLDFEW